MKHLLFIFMVLFSFSVDSQEKKLTWDYPVKPGMDEWKKFQSAEEMINACQIPDDILSSLSTEELADLCLRYPLIEYVFAFDNLNSGLDKLFSDFNGIREFYKKRDVSTNLLNRYVQKTQASSFLDEKNADYEKGQYIVTISLLEVLLSRSIEQNEWTKEKSKEVLQALVAGYEEKLKHVDYFKGVGFRSNVYSRVQIISEMSKQGMERLPQKENNPVKLSGMADEETLRIIDELSYQLIK
jgi:hypothetical protein